MDLIVQKIQKQEESLINQAIKYYALICLVNDIKLHRRDIELLAYTALRGTISSLSAKQEFSRQFGSSVSTVNNIISKLSSMGLLEKSQGKYKINDKIDIDFKNRDVVLQIKIVKKDETLPEPNIQG
jgi:hypoxanthine-guanine phosphoribosyltransferase